MRKLFLIDGGDCLPVTNNDIVSTYIIHISICIVYMNVYLVSVWTVALHQDGEKYRFLQSTISSLVPEVYLCMIFSETLPWV